MAVVEGEEGAGGEGWFPLWSAFGALADGFDRTAHREQLVEIESLKRIGGSGEAVAVHAPDEGITGDSNEEPEGEGGEELGAARGQETAGEVPLVPVHGPDEQEK